MPRFVWVIWALFLGACGHAGSAGTGATGGTAGVSDIPGAGRDAGGGVRAGTTSTGGEVATSTGGEVATNPSRQAGRYVALVAPTSGESFVAPSALRLTAAAYDPNVYTNVPTEGHGGNAVRIQFLVDDELVASELGSDAEYWIFQRMVSGIAAGQHRVWARAVYANPELVLDSEPALIQVAEPVYDRTIDLTGNLLVGSPGYELIGSADHRIRLNGHGFRIISSKASALTFKFVDAFDLGNPNDTAEPGVEVSTSGSLLIEDSTFDTSNTLSFSLEDKATASVQRNLFRSNMRMPIGQFPADYTPGSRAAVHFAGSSSGTKVFAGNNVGAGWIEFVNTQEWLVGGNSDQASNILIGPRVGIYSSGSTRMTIRRNYSHHVYFGGWSQGANFELFGTTASTIEHNVIFGSSWPVRGCGKDCQFQYNLVLEAGHQWMWPGAGSSVHHNLFLGGENDVGGLYVYSDAASPSAPAVNIYNNTFDGLGAGAMAIKGEATASAMAIRSNLFLDFPRAPVVTALAAFTADYNGFFPAPSSSYSDSRKPAHDLSAASPGLQGPPKVLFDGAESAIWQRTTTVASVLERYRDFYTPAAGSPLIDAGDPAEGAGNDIGAVGAGIANAADQFGSP